MINVIGNTTITVMTMVVATMAMVSMIAMPRHRVFLLAHSPHR